MVHHAIGPNVPDVLVDELQIIRHPFDKHGIRRYLEIFITFESDFQIKLAIYGLSLSHTCPNMSELEFFK